MSEQLLAALVGAAAGGVTTWLVIALRAAMKFGAGNARLTMHADLLKALANDVRANAASIAKLSQTQAVVIEHQRGQDEKLGRVLDGLDKVSQRLGQVPCVGTRNRCRPNPISDNGD